MKTFAVLLLTMSLIPNVLAAQPGRTKVLLHQVPFTPGVPISDAALTALGAARVRNYEAFTLATIPTSSIGGFVSAAAARDVRAEVFDEWDTVSTPGYTVDVRNPVLPPDGVTTRYETGRGLYLVQFDGPTSAATVDDLRAAGCTYIGYVPYNSALVVANDEAIANIQHRPDVQWTSIYHRAFKAQPSSFPTDVRVQEYTIQIAAANGSEQTASAILANAAPGATETDYGDFRNFHVTMSPSAAAAFLADPYVVAIQHRPDSYMSGEREAIGVTYLLPSGCTAQPYAYQCKASYTDPQTHTTRTYVAPHKSGAGYTGWLNAKPIFGSTSQYMLDTSMYKVAIADTGLDVGSTSTCHPDFAPCTRIQYTSYRDRQTSQDGQYLRDDVGHGSMVTGLATAYPAAQVNTDVLTGYGSFSYGVGLAPKAHILSQQIMDKFGVPIFTTRDPNHPSGIQNWVNEAFVTYGATVQTHSWNDYDTTTEANGGRYLENAQTMDYAITDITYTPPTAGWKRPVTISAGNVCGGSGDYTQGDCSTMVLSPATAKNVIAVGASESFRSITACDTGTRQPQDFWADSLNNVAYVSRRATIDGRYKPDVLAPGTMVSSTRTYYLFGMAAQPKFCVNIAGNYYSIDTGTSFSAPQVAAATILIDRYRNTTFSAPMLKAALVGTAISSKGGRDSSDLSTVAARPNAVQGFGRINIDGIVTNSPVQTFLDEGSMPAFSASGQVRSRTFTIQNNATTTTIVLAWGDYPAQIDANPTLVRDLDLSITTPSGGVFVGNRLSSSEVSIAKNPPDPSDTRNNVELIVIPAYSGLTTFTVDVSCKKYGGIGYQSYALFLSNAQ